MNFVDFVYVSPNALFSAPFMGSFQSPECGSSYFFPRIMGNRLASEVLLLDKKLTAQEAVKCGFATAILPNLSKGELIDYKEIPGVDKLLATDFDTLVNCKKLLISARDNNKIEEVLFNELVAL
eukprot:CAMPEP_0116879484 /NCGR_PEP_ID=MMETSP0463-20121206/11299_1 /TAXON_ID=181622 /ORGANISM="Strombidinopsis sp, Strain SopsisLIS2011" /LENGTH=123 /DNA_ID=CAMNT_0004528881 /DNA_START=270 /DNA_END=641 /DNA_ORIENTATION=+